jgi:hypothetical protein
VDEILDSIGPLNWLEQCELGSRLWRESLILMENTHNV